MALLTGEIVADFVKQGYSAHNIATAVAFMTGIYSLAIGLFKLGFLLDFIPLPVLSGYVSAAALTIVIGQIPTLFGEKNIGSTTGDVIHDFFQKLPTTQWLARFSCWILGTAYAGFDAIYGSKMGQEVPSCLVPINLQKCIGPRSVYGNQLRRE